MTPKKEPGGLARVTSHKWNGSTLFFVEFGAFRTDGLVFKEYADKAADEINTAAQSLEQAAELRGWVRGQNIPGRWVCKECGLQMTTKIISLSDVGMDVDPRPPACLNDALPMIPVTWKGECERLEAEIRSLLESKRKEAGL